MKCVSKFTRSMAVFAALSVAGGAASAGGGDKAASAISASDAFVRLPAKALDLLTTSMRKDMLDYYKNDSIYKVKNAMGGESYIIEPVTQDYIKVQVTPVTVLTVKLLPSKHGPVVMTLYTTGDSLQARDSDIRFYDRGFKELPRDKYIKSVSTADFLDVVNLKGREREKLKSLVPFTTVEYSVSPESMTLTANLTVAKILGKEALEMLSPHLDCECLYRWAGSRFVKVKRG